MIILLAGMAIGLAMAAPLGPVNLIVIRAALNQGWRSALVSGAGAVVADAMMASIAAFGLSTVEHFVRAHTAPLQFAGGAVLVLLGIRTTRMHFTSADLATPPRAKRASLTFLLTVSNPGTALGFLAIFTALSATLQLGSAAYRSTTVIAGVMIGGCLWWLFVALLVNMLRTRFRAQTLERINHWSGVLITAFGFILLIEAVV